MNKTLKIISAGLTLLFAGCFGTSNKPENAKSTVPFYSLSYTSNSGEKISLADTRGKKVLIVNTASKCGYTPQYEELEALYKSNTEKLIIIAFPANEFLSQEPGSDTEIAEFCKVNYGVTFPLAQKSIVAGDEKNEVFEWLTNKDKNGWNTQAPKWNFYKYLIDEKGELTHVFPSQTKPSEIASFIK